MKQVLRLWFVLAVIFLSACTIGSPDESVAYKQVEAFYGAVQNNDVPGALKYCSDKRTPEQWQLHLEHVKKSLGDVTKYEMINTEVNTVLSGRFYILEFLVTYSKGEVSKETITLFDTVETDDMPMIVSHVISANGYRPLF